MDGHSEVQVTVRILCVNAIEINPGITTHGQRSKKMIDHLKVAELCQLEEDCLLELLHGVVHVHVLPIVPEDGAGEHVEAEGGQIVVVVAVVGDVGAEVQGLLEVHVVGVEVLAVNVELR